MYSRGLNNMVKEKTVIYRQIGAKIAYYRNLKQMTQAELAEKVHMSESTIGRIERGKYNSGVPLPTLVDIAGGLGVNLASLVTFTEEETRLCLEVDKNLVD